MPYLRRQARLCDRDEGELLQCVIARSSSSAVRVVVAMLSANMCGASCGQVCDDIDKVCRLRLLGAAKYMLASCLTRPKHELAIIGELKLASARWYANTVHSPASEALLTSMKQQSSSSIVVTTLHQ